MLRRLDELWKKYQLTAVTIAMIALVIVVFIQSEMNNNKRFQDQQETSHRFRTAEIDRNYASCLDTREFRQTFAEFLDQSAAQSNQGVDFSQLKTFAALDPATKAFLQELFSVRGGGVGGVRSVAEQYKKRFFPLPDCAKNREKSLKALGD